MIKTVFKWVGWIILLLIPCAMFTLMIAMQISKHRYNNQLNNLLKQIKTNQHNYKNNHLLRQFNNHPNKPIRILVMNGGGVHGLVQLQVLKYLEKKTGKSINQLFDEVGCVSTGCLNLGMLLTPNPQHLDQPLYSPNYLINAYPNLAALIFEKPFFHKIRSLDGILMPAFSSLAKGLLLARYMGDVRIEQLLLPVYICTTHLSDLSSDCFNTWDNSDKQYYAANVINAASSPPAVFYPVNIQKNITAANSIHEIIKHGDLHQTYTDSVLVVNDPSLQMVLNIRTRHPKNPIVLVNIGTAGDKYSLGKNAASWSPIKWVFNALDIMYAARTQYISQGMDYLVRHHPNTIKYYFINSNEDKDVPILSGSPKVVGEVKQLGVNMVNDNKKLLQKVIQALNNN